ncbi:MAG: hypothetical protein ACREHV_12405 [Rhizomicrobium sp.]
MTKLLEKAVGAVMRLPTEYQDEIALAMLNLAARGGEPESVHPDHLPAGLEGLAQAGARNFADNEEIEAAFRRFDP